MNSQVAIEMPRPYQVVPSEDEAIIQKAIAILASRLRNGESLCSPDSVRNYLQLRLAELQDEVFGCIYLDNQHKVIKTAELFRGTIDGASVYPRVVARECLSANAAAVIFYHNHPSGMAEPSRADQSLTAKLKNALNLLDIRVLDHLVVGGAEVTSFAEKGLL